MEQRLKEAVSYATNVFGDKPMLLFGSRADGSNTSTSDWDVCVMGDRVDFLKLGKTLDISCLKRERFGLDIASNIHGRVATTFAKGVVPLKHEDQVRTAERYVKMNITNYILKGMDASQKDVTGRDVILSYLKENVNYYPVYKPRMIKFLKSKTSLDLVSKQYDELLEGERFPFEAEYNGISRLNTIYGLTVKGVVGLIKKPVATINLSKKILSEYPKCALTDLETIGSRADTGHQ